MEKLHTLSFWEALLITINIMLGSGIFINTVTLGSQAGAASILVYLSIGLLFFPLIYTIAALLKLSDKGTFYDFGALLSPFVGFLSSWSYFTAKMASSVLSMHVCVTLIQQIFPLTGMFPALYCDIVLLVLFVWLNSFNLKMGSTLQFYFIILKLIPLFFAIISGLVLFNVHYFGAEYWHFEGIPASLPLVIFAFSGFEASCSLSRRLKNPEKTGPRVLFAAYSIVLILALLYQTFFWGAVGPALGIMTGFTQAFPALYNALSFSQKTKTVISVLMHAGIATSALGASYGIMYSNAWNLYTLAVHGHVFNAQLFSRLNEHGVPFFCVLVEGLLAFLYILITQGQHVQLQQISALGSTIAYTISVIAYIIITKKNKAVISLLALGALLSCSVFLGALFYAYQQKGAISLILFGLLLLSGIVQYTVRARRRAHKSKAL